VSSKTRSVKTEEKIRAHAMVELHEGVEEVVNMFGVVGSFDEPGGGDAAIIGDPDFSWVMGGAQSHPKLVVCVSTTLYDFLLNSGVGEIQGVVGSGSCRSSRCLCRYS
jgi:hypothetical protein